MIRIHTGTDWSSSQHKFIRNSRACGWLVSRPITMLESCGVCRAGLVLCACSVLPVIKKEKGESTDRFYLLLMDSGLVSDLDEFLGLRFWREWCRLPGFMGTQNTSRAMQAGTFMGSRIYMHQKRRRRRNILGSNHKCVHRLQKYLNRMITGHKIVTLLNCTLVPTLD